MLSVIIDTFTTLLCSTILGAAINKVLTPKINVVISVLIMTSITTGIYLISSYSSWYQNLIPEFDVQQNLKTFILTLSYLLYPLLLFKDTVIQKLKLFVVLIISLVVYEGVITSFTVIFLDITSVEENNINITMRIGVGFLEIMAYILMALTILMCFRKKDLKIHISVLINFMAIILINCVMIAFIFTSNAYNKDNFTKTILLISPILLLLLCFTFYRLLVKLSDQEVLKEKLYWAENVKTLELEYYNNLQQKSNEVRKIRHDFKENIETINLLVAENTDESIFIAKKMLKSLNSSIKASNISIYTDNVVVNAVVGAKVDEANRENIDVDVSIDLPQKLEIESIDLNCVFLNLLNNAIESCKKLPEDVLKKITLKSAIQAGYLIVKTENPYTVIETDNQGKIKTTKFDKENHGLGMTLINDIANKYKGTFETTTEDNMFTAVVSLKV